MLFFINLIGIWMFKVNIKQILDKKTLRWHSVHFLLSLMSWNHRFCVAVRLVNCHFDSWFWSTYEAYLHINVLWDTEHFTTTNSMCVYGLFAFLCFHCVFFYPISWKLKAKTYTHILFNLEWVLSLCVLFLLCNLLDVWVQEVCVFYEIISVIIRV